MKKICVTIVLGSPASNCAKYGICSIEEEKNPVLWDQFVPLHHRHVKAILSQDIPGKLQLQFPKESMHPITPGMFFSTAGFLIESSKTIPETIAHQLNLLEGSAFLSGTWPIVNGSNSYIVSIPCMAHCHQ